MRGSADAGQSFSVAPINVARAAGAACDFRSAIAKTETCESIVCLLQWALSWLAPKSNNVVKRSAALFSTPFGQLLEAGAAAAAPFSFRSPVPEFASCRNT